MMIDSCCGLFGIGALTLSSITILQLFMWTFLSEYDRYYHRICSYVSYDLRTFANMRTAYALIRYVYLVQVNLIINVVQFLLYMCHLCII